jgi:hypothetical protein
VNRRQFLQAALAAVGAAGCTVSAPAPTLTTPPTLTATPPPAPVLIPRAAWDARPVNPDAEMESGALGWYVYEGDLAEIYRTVAVHHSAHRLASDNTMRDLQDIHMDRNRWADIGYHYGIDAEGLIYAGRDLSVRGASVAGYNTGTAGVVVMGNFELEEPRPAQLAALQTLVIWLTYTLRLTHLAAHSEFNPESVCPGRYLYAHLDALAAAAGLARGIGGYVAPAETSTPTPEL